MYVVNNMQATTQRAIALIITTQDLIYNRATIVEQGMVS